MIRMITFYMLIVWHEVLDAWKFCIHPASVRVVLLNMTTCHLFIVLI